MKILQLQTKLPNAFVAENALSKIKDKYETNISKLQDDLANEKQISQQLRKERDGALAKLPSEIPAPSGWTLPPPLDIGMSEMVLPPPIELNEYIIPPEDDMSDIPPPPDVS
jgi:hypothetical protein